MAAGSADMLLRHLRKVVARLRATALPKKVGMEPTLSGSIEQRTTRDLLARSPNMSSGQLSVLLRHIRQWAGGSMTRDVTDQQLLDRFVRQREEAAFALLVERHGPMVLRVCQRVLGNYHAAEDAFPATFLVLVRKARAIGRRDLLSNW